MKQTVILFLFLLISSLASAKNYLVSDIEKFNNTIHLVQPGDTIFLSEGKWENVKLTFRGTGTEKRPVVLQAQTPGKTIICGKSSLQLAGKYLEVRNLFFTEGEPIEKNAIEFKDDEGNPASYSKLSNCIMIDYNNPDKNIRRQWVDLYGVYNTVEYCYFRGKTDLGVVLGVEPIAENHQKNHHRIHHNYFAHRPPFNANGGEIIRIARGETHHLSCNTIVEDNYFEHCDGEGEIISVKSCDNIIRGNVFYECLGGVSLRHGMRNEVSGNFFLTNGKKGTLGVTVHFEGHKIYNNYFYKNPGTSEYGTAISLVSGTKDIQPSDNVPSYEQVKNIQIVNNTFVNCALALNLGVINEARKRTELPENILIANNLIYSPTKDKWLMKDEKAKDLKFFNNLICLKDSCIFNGVEVDASIKEIKTGNLIFPVDTVHTAKSPDNVRYDISGELRKKGLTGALEYFNFSSENLPNPSNCGPVWYR